MDLTQRLDAAIESALAQKTIVGTVVLVNRHGEPVYARAAGMADREAGLPVAQDTIFRLASVTKPLVAATALAQIERGLLGLDHAVSDYLPYFRPALADGTPATIRIRHLLTHTAGLSYDYPPEAGIDTGLGPETLSFEENFTRLAAQPLRFTPGSQWLYSVAIDVLGAIVAGVHGGSLDDAVQHYVAGPLGMADTGFAVTDLARLAQPYADARPEPVRMGDIQPVPNEDGTTSTFAPIRIFTPGAMQSGGAGAVGTAPDLMVFLEALRTGGSPILRRETAVAGLSNQIGALRSDPGHGFGFFGSVLEDPATGERPGQNPGTIAWGGIYGHNWFIDPAEGLTVVSFSNTAVEGCIGRYRDAIRNAVYDV